MAEEEEDRNWLRILAPRILKAAFWGFVMGGEILIPMYLIPDFTSQFEMFIPVRQIGLPVIAAVFVGFEVVIQLLDGTIHRYAFSTARTMISMMLLIVFTNGGIIELSVPPGVLPPQAGNLQVVVDFRTIIVALLAFSLMSIMKNILEAIDFLSQKAEEPAMLPELP